MSENAKTIAFVVVGLLAVTIGLITQPRSAEVADSEQIGRDLTEDFSSADAAKRLRIVRFNEDTATLREFEVAEEDGLWSIPSKNGYPADAALQMAEAATSLTDRKILEVASKSAGDHEEYGVIDPLSPKLEVGQKGVGTRVTMRDVHNEPLVDLIVGKAVKDAEGQRYVREAGRDIVYVIEIDPSKLSTNFEDWIEKDLLKLDAWDLQQVEIKDYSAEMHLVMNQQGNPALGLSMDPRSEVVLAYDDTDAKWNAEKLRKFDPATKSYSKVTLAENEELNTEALNGLKTALDDLQIVDVARKPQGLSNDLKAGADFLNDMEALQDLVSKGFIPAQAPGESGPEELISSDGEVIATMKNGAEYVLRFGNLTNAGGEEDGTPTDPAAATAGGEQPAGGDGVHRYLFVMARLNESAVKRPELEELPELPAGAEAATEKSDGETETSSDSASPNGNAPAAGSSEEAAGDEAPASENATAADASAETATEEESTAEGGNGQSEANSDDSAAAETADAGNSDPEAAAADADADAASRTEADAASNDAADGNSSEGAPDEQTADAQNANEAADASENDKRQDLDQIIADRKRIEEENQRKLDEYKETLEKGRENVKQLNLRFGDWYFVVADDVFEKVRLSLDDVIKQKETADAAAGSASGDATSTEVQTPGSVIPGLPTIPGTKLEE